MNKQFWTLDKDGNEVLRDLKKEHENFSIEKYNAGEFDSNNFIWYENFDMYLMDANGCDYERKGCFIQEGDVVVDIGANIGIFAHRAELRGASKVICFEPFSQTFECLKKNAGPKTEVYKLAIGGNNRFEKFALHTDYTHVGGVFNIKNTDLSKNKNLIKTESSLVIDVNLIFDNNLTDRIDFLKIDVEGSEIEILDSLTDDNLKKVRCVAIELHKTNEEFEIFQEKILDRMFILGFQRFILYHGTDTSATLRTFTCWK